MSIFKRVSNLFKSNAKPEQQVTAARTVANLKLQDIVTYDLEDYIVVGKIIYEDSGYEWTSYQLRGDERSLWLSYEVDDEVEIGIYETTKVKLEEPLKQKITVDGFVYELDEKGKSHIRAKEGQAGLPWGNRSTIGAMNLKMQNTSIFPLRNGAGT